MKETNTNQRDAVLIRKYPGGYVFSSAVQAPGDEVVFSRFDELMLHLKKRLDK